MTNAMQEMKDVERKASEVKATLRFYRAKLRMLKSHNAPADDTNDVEYRITQLEKELKGMTTMRKNAKAALSLAAAAPAMSTEGTHAT